MRRDDYVLMIASGLLGLDDDRRASALAYFSERFELQHLRAPDCISIGGLTADGKEAGLAEWISILRNENLQNIFFYWSDERQHGALAPHVAAAFAGSQQLLMHISTAKKERSYVLRTMFSPQYEMTPEQFVAVIDAQSIHKKLWTRIAGIVRDSNRMNGRADFEPAYIRQYLVGEGKSELDFLYGQLLQEVQVECAVHNIQFYIPDNYKNLFFKSDFSFGDDERESVFLYPLSDVSAVDLLALIDAQSFKKSVWEKFKEEVSQYPESIPDYPASEWPEKIHTLDTIQLAATANWICRAISSLCEEENVPRIIPDSLGNQFGPDDEEHARAQARSRAGRNQYYLQSNAHAWEAYFFDLVSEVYRSREDRLPVLENFRSTLKEIESFAFSIQSPFAEAFRLALLLLSDSFPVGNFDHKHQQQIGTLLVNEEFSEQAISHLNNVTQYAEDMLMLNFSEEKMRGLMAISVADVFGGMGSWNDQYIENDQATYERVSANVFRALKDFFAHTLSGN